MTTYASVAELPLDGQRAHGGGEADGAVLALVVVEQREDADREEGDLHGRLLLAFLIEESYLYLLLVIAYEILF